MNDNKIAEMIRTSIDGIKSSFDANTVTGEPVTTANGTVIIPVSKVSVGFASGGLDFLSKNAAKESPQNFGGGGGTGVSVSPVAFLIISASGKVELLNVNDTHNSPYDTVSQIIGAIERSPELIEKLKNIFKKKDKEEE